LSINKKNVSVKNISAGAVISHAPTY